MVAVGDTAALIQYVNSQAASYGLDPAAVLATAHVEGWGGTIGDGGHAYGPWQDHLTDFKERPWYGAGTNNAQVQTWAWSSEGINYALNQMATTGKARGLSGYQAVVNINTFYERSADIPGQIWRAWNNWYKSFANGSAVGTSGSVSTVDPSLASGAAIVSGSSDGTEATAGSSAGGSTFQLVPGLTGPGGLNWPGIKISTGFLWSAGFFILAGLLIIAGLVFAFRRQIEATAASAARGLA
jgi:hypothetical protein